MHTSSSTLGIKFEHVMIVFTIIGVLSAMATALYVNSAIKEATAPYKEKSQEEMYSVFRDCMDEYLADQAIQEFKYNKMRKMTPHNLDISVYKSVNGSQLSQNAQFYNSEFLLYRTPPMIFR